MSTAAVPSSGPGPQEPDKVLGLTRAAWKQIGVIGGLMALVFWPNLRRLWLKTNPVTGDPNWGHSVIVPVVGLYYLYVNREELLAEPVRPLNVGGWSGRQLMSSLGMAALGLVLCAAVWFDPGLDVAGGPGKLGQGMVVWGVLSAALDWGLGSLVFGLIVYAYGIYPGQNDYVKDLGMVLTLFGVVLFLCGWRVMRVAWFPVAFLVCALPWPGLVYSKVALPLQNLAAYVAVQVLQLTGLVANKSGTKILIEGPGGPSALNVAEACAGMRSLMTFISVGGAVAFLSNRPLWQKLIITAMGVPIAIFCNVMRVSGQGLLDSYVSHKWSEGFAHAFAGMVMLVPGFFLILLVGWVLDKLFIEEADEDAASPSAAERPASADPGLVVEIPRRKGASAPAKGADGDAAGAPAPGSAASPLVIEIPRRRPPGQGGGGGDGASKGGA